MQTEQLYRLLFTLPILFAIMYALFLLGLYFSVAVIAMVISLLIYDIANNPVSKAELPLTVFIASIFIFIDIIYSSIKFLISSI